MNYGSLGGLQELFAQKMDLQTQIKTEQDALAAAPNDENAGRQTALYQSKAQMTLFLRREWELMQSSFGDKSLTDQEIAPEAAETDQTQGDSEPEDTTEGNNVKFNFKLTRPEKFKDGQNFADFCEDFREHIELTRMKDDNLYIFFLSLLENQVKKKLRKVTLEPEQKRNAGKFIPIYRRKMMPPHEAENLQMDFSDLSQGKDETIESFSHRVEDIASLAFAEDTEKALNDACFSAFVKGLRDVDLRIKLREGKIRKFSTVVEEACRVNGIKEAEQRRRAVTEPVTEADHVYLIQDESTHRRSEVERSARRSEVERPARRSEVDRSARQEPPNSDDNSRRDTSYRRANGRGGRESRGRSQGERNRYPGREKLCYKCNQPNHLARHCLLEDPLNY